MIVGIMLLLAGCTGGGTDDPGSGGSGDPGTVSDGGDNTGTDDGNAAGNEPVTGTETDGKCEITAFATGKADSLLIRSGDVNILIDAGEETDAELICSRMKEKGVSRIDLLIVTHFDRDHAGGVPQIMENFEVEEVYYPDYATTKDAYLAFRRAISGMGSDGKITAVTQYKAGDLTLNIYPETDPDKLRAKSDDFENDMSLVCMLYYKNYRFFFAGDIEKERISELLDAQQETDGSAVSLDGVALKCDWIKMPHHGRYNKKIKKLLDACEPAYAILTDSDAEIAETDTLVELEKRKIRSFSIRKGEIVTVANDQGITVSYAGQ